jgi:hypothetical protein
MTLAETIQIHIQLLLPASATRDAGFSNSLNNTMTQFGQHQNRLVTLRHFLQ